MKLEFSVFDVWVFRRSSAPVEYLLLHTSQLKADRYFNGGRFWQIPSDSLQANETVVAALHRCLGDFGIRSRGLWAAEHTYTIYNRRFESMQIIGVYAAEALPGDILLDPDEHSESRWCTFEDAMARVTYRGLKDGLLSTREYVTGRAEPPRELRLA